VLSSRCSSAVKRQLLLLSYNSQKTAAYSSQKDCCCYCPTAVKRLLLSYNRDAVRIALFTTKQRCCPPHEDRMTYSIILPLSLVHRLVGKLSHPGPVTKLKELDPPKGLGEQVRKLIFGLM
jgi:hypothetical protein